MSDFTDLEIFARVARTGNMSAAARELQLSPAVISKRISLLESRLNARLFQRTTRQLHLTDIGEGYFRRVVDILNLTEEADDFVNRRNTNPRGALKIASPDLFALNHIVPHLAEFRLRYPDIELDLLTSSDETDLIRDGLDIAIVLGTGSETGLELRRLATAERVLVAAPSYIAAHGRPGAPNELEVHNCMFVGNASTWRLSSVAGPRSVRVRSAVRASSAALVRSGLLAGIGVGLPCVFEVHDDLKCGRLERILPDYHGGQGFSVFAAYPSKDFLPAKVECFVNFLEERCAEAACWCLASRKTAVIEARV